MARILSVQEISKHNIPDDLWLVVDDTVYDLTDFALEHPGGANSMSIPSSFPTFPSLNSLSNPPLRRPRRFSSIQRNPRSLANTDLSPLLKDPGVPRSQLHNQRMGQASTKHHGVLLPGHETTPRHPHKHTRLRLCSAPNPHHENMGILFLRSYRSQHKSAEQLRIHRHWSSAAGTS